MDFAELGAVVLTDAAPLLAREDPVICLCLLESGPETLVVEDGPSALWDEVGDGSPS